MERVVGKKRVEKFRKEFRRPLIRARSGEIVPDFREKNGTGMDVTDICMENVVRDDVVSVLHMINNSCPVAKVSHMSGASDTMTLYIAKLRITIVFNECKVEYVRVEPMSFDTNVRKYKTLADVLKLDIVKNSIEYEIVKAKLQKQYSIK